ncbi:hypothetical protein D3C86_1364770 [compost metagenome]
MLTRAWVISSIMACCSGVKASACLPQKRESSVSRSEPIRVRSDVIMGVSRKFLTQVWNSAISWSRMATTSSTMPARSARLRLATECRSSMSNSSTPGTCFSSGSRLRGTEMSMNTTGRSAERWLRRPATSEAERM